MAEHGRKRWRLVVVASPLQGHMTPVLQLATFLHSKGFSITIVHSESNRPDPSNHPDFVFLPLPDDLSGTKLSTSFIKFLKMLNDICKPLFHDHLIQMMNAQNEKESIVIIHDYLMFFAGSVASNLGLPSIILRPSCAAFFPAYKIIPQLYQEGRYPIQDSMLQEVVPELHPFRYQDLPFTAFPVQRTLQLITMITPETPPSAFIWNTVECLEQSALSQIRNHYQVPVFTVGPLHQTSPTPLTSILEEDTNCITWLDKQMPKSVMYISLGSLVTMDEKVAVEMAAGLANSGQPFLWVVRPGSVSGSDWIEFLQDSDMKARGLIVKWAPQKEVLAHPAVGGFWSHCGWNSTLESVSEGVPMLCQPFNTDQMLNARYLSYIWKMGVEVITERGAIERGIQRILVDKEGEEMRRRATEIQENVKTATSNCGSSHKSLEDLVDFILSL